MVGFIVVTKSSVDLPSRWFWQFASGIGPTVLRKPGLINLLSRVRNPSSFLHQRIQTIKPLYRSTNFFFFTLRKLGVASALSFPSLGAIEPSSHNRARQLKLFRVITLGTTDNWIFFLSVF